MSTLAQASSFADHLATLNAALNASCATLLICGRVAIGRKNVALHRRCMIGAVLVSALFLTSYLTRVALSGTHRFAGPAWLRGTYLVILATHVVLAAAVVPLVARSVQLAWTGRFDAHRRIARITFPIWLYVSATGVAVYLMLYHLPR